MEEKKKLMSLNDFISGSVAGIVQVLLGQPFDMVKVRLQTQPDKYKSPVDCFKSTLKNEGPTAFYKGTLSPLIGISLCVAVQFGSNELAKNFFKKNNKNQTLAVRDYIFCGMFAGFCNSFVMSPVELIRIKLQVQGSASTGANQYSGTVDCASRIFKQYGIKGIYQGFSATLFREIPAYAVYFGVYESMMAKSEKKYGQKKNIPLLNVMSYGALSGICLWLFTFPNDVIKSRMQADSLEQRKYPTIMSTMATINKENGIKGFFRGLTPCLMRAPPINAATFLTFEIVQKLMNSYKN
jgi:solute carrier family 25 (mitochondrial carnitine/acylcarnitine transporter), member 20/29